MSQAQPVLSFRSFFINQARRQFHVPRFGAEPHFSSMLHFSGIVSVLWTCHCKKIKLSLCANIRGKEETLAFYAFSVPSARLLHHREMKLALRTEMNGLKLLVAADALRTALQPGRWFSFITPAVVHWPVSIFFRISD